VAPAVVLILPKTGYRNEDFLAAAKKLGAEVIQASDVCHRLAGRSIRLRSASAKRRPPPASWPRRSRNGIRWP